MDITSQAELLVRGQGSYKHLFDIVPAEQVTNRNTEQHENVNIDDSGHALVLKTSYSNGDQYISGEHFSVKSISVPMKARINEKVTGRYLADLDMLAMRHLKKAIAFAEEHLNDGKLPSVTTWDDLYAHLFSLGNNISKEKSRYIG